MKHLFLFMSSFVFMTGIARCQVNPLDTLGYRMSVVANVKDVALVTGMPIGEQKVLAAFFQSAEDAMNTAVNSGITGNALIQLQNQQIAQFQSILTPQELAVYRQQRKYAVYAKVLTTN